MVRKCKGMFFFTIMLAQRISIETGIDLKTMRTEQGAGQGLQEACRSVTGDDSQCDLICDMHG